MIPDAESAENPYAGSVETSQYTEKELEPLRNLVQEMARVRYRIVSVERRRRELGPEYYDYVDELILEATGIYYQAEPIAEALGQLDQFSESANAKVEACGEDYAIAIFAFFAAVDLLLFSNGLTRSVSPPQEDPVEKLRKAIAVDLLNRHGVGPFVVHPVESSTLRDTLIEAIWNGIWARLDGFNDPISTLAFQAALKKLLTSLGRHGREALAKAVSAKSFFG